ncbi:MAG: 50S ribosomal protein L25 [Gemmatimonadota bacterium]|jgi:large subunit ribosomal protein L25
MPANASLKAQLRAGTGKGAARKTRAEGRIPAVLYGHGEETRLLTVDAHELELLFSRIHVESTVVEVTIEGDKKPLRALVREVQKHAHRSQLLHVDFYQIHAGERITVSVPLRLAGASAGVKAGGLLQHALDEIEIRCLPDAIPEAIVADVSALGIGESLHVRDLIAPENVELYVDGDRTVCSVMPPIVAAVEEEEVEEEVVEEGESAEPEVIGKGRTEEETGDE